MLEKEEFRIPPGTGPSPIPKEEDEGLLLQAHTKTGGSSSPNLPTPSVYGTSHFCESRRLRTATTTVPVSAVDLPLKSTDGVTTPANTVSPPSPGARTCKWEDECEDRVAVVQRLAAEDDEGDVEYKWRLVGITELRFQHLVTQMQFRVSEGNGQCLYELGVADNGVPRGLPLAEIEESITTIQRMSAALGFEATVLQQCVVRSGPQPLYCAEMMVSRRYAGSRDVGVAFCGVVESGKSTLIGVLLTGSLDDGSGSTRQSLFNHKHEINSGRTSSIVTRMWSVSCGQTTLSRSGDSADEDSEGRGMTPHHSNPELNETNLSAYQLGFEGKRLGSPSLPPRSPMGQVRGGNSSQQRLITLMDVGGDITKTMLFGLMSREPDYVCVCIAAGSLVEMVTLYAEVCSAIETPFLLVVTKCDLMEEFEMDNYVMELAAVLDRVGFACDLIEDSTKGSEYCDKWLPLHHSEAFLLDTCKEDPLADKDTGRRRVPIFFTSSVTGEGLDVFRRTIARLQQPLPSPPHSPTSQPPFEVLLDCAFAVKSIGPVVKGRVSHGAVEVGRACYVGPDDDGAFHAVTITGIHVDGVYVSQALTGDEATFALSQLPDAVNVMRKGKVLVGQPERVTDTFVITVKVLSQTLSEGMEPILYSRNMRQAIRIQSICPCEAEADLPSPSSGPRSSTDEEKRQSFSSTHASMDIECQFLFRPEVVQVGSPVVLQWTDGIAVGKVKCCRVS